MDCFAKELTPEHIPEGLWREVAETIGAENLYKLAELIGGATLYIPKPESLTRPIRDAHIKAEFNGWNHLELAKKYNVTDRLVRQVCGPGCTEGQLNLFEAGEEDIIAVFIPDSVSIFIKKIFPPLFLYPCAIRVKRAHGCHHMEMRVRDTAVLFLLAVKSKIGNHAFCHKLLLHELPRQFHVFFQRQFILHGNIKGIGKLCFWMFLAALHSIPEGRPVKIYFRRMGRQHDFRSDHAALFGVVADFSIVAAVKAIPGSVGCAGNGALTGAALYLCD